MSSSSSPHTPENSMIELDFVSAAELMRDRKRARSRTLTGDQQLEDDADLARRIRRASLAVRGTRKIKALLAVIEEKECEIMMLKKEIEDIRNEMNEV